METQPTISDSPQIWLADRPSHVDSKKQNFFEIG